MLEWIKNLFVKKQEEPDEDVHLHQDSIYPYDDMHKVLDEAAEQNKLNKKQLDEDAIRKAGW